MASVQKTRSVSFKTIDKDRALTALRIYTYGQKMQEIKGTDYASLTDKINRENFYNQSVRGFGLNSYNATLAEIRGLVVYFDENSSLEEIYHKYMNFLYSLEKEPIKFLVDGKLQWVFNGYTYEIRGDYSDEQIRLLILEDFDKERRYFEKLKTKFDDTKSDDTSHKRPRIPENVRNEVWRRDGGKCIRCGSREKLEYVYIVPISRGGSNTARNIELLCEKHNRSKSNNIV